VSTGIPNDTNTANNFIPYEFNDIYKMLPAHTASNYMSRHRTSAWRAMEGVRDICDVAECKIDSRSGIIYSPAVQWVGKSQT